MISITLNWRPECLTSEPTRPYLLSSAKAGLTHLFLLLSITAARRCSGEETEAFDLLFRGHITRLLIELGGTALRDKTQRVGSEDIIMKGSGADRSSAKTPFTCLPPCWSPPPPYIYIYSSLSPFFSLAESIAQQR